jgi:hypothetical protein
MSFINSCKLLLKFDDINLIESISSTSMVAAGGNTSVDILPDGMGYIMKQDQYLSQEEFSGDGFYLDINQELIIGFWLYPGDPGLVDDSNPSGRSLKDGIVEPVQMPLIDITSYGHENYSLISIKEKTYNNESNFLIVELRDEQNTSGLEWYRFSTSTYTAGLWHYFWIVYDGVNKSLNVYVDGSLQFYNEKVSDNELTKPNQQSNDVPSVIHTSHSELYINRSAEGYSYNIAGNYGFVDDIVIFNEITNSKKNLQRSINFSIDYVVDKDFVNIDKDFYGVMFNDPSTIRINSFVDDQSFVFLTQNNGQILRGSPLFWENRKIFSDPREANLYDESIVSATGSESDAATCVDAEGNPTGFLKITNSILRF